jgi:hypothetical protein
MAEMWSSFSFVKQGFDISIHLNILNILISKYLDSIITKIYSHNQSIRSYTYTWRSVQMSQCMSVTAKTAEEVPIGLEDLNPVVPRICNDNIAFLVDAHTLGSHKLRYTAPFRAEELCTFAVSRDD